MSTLTPAAIYNAVFAGRTVKVSCPPDQWPSLRVAVAKRHTTPRGLEMTDKVLRATYDKEARIATFSFRDPKPPRTFAVIAIDEAPE